MDLNCPRCDSDRIVGNGKNSAGTQRYICKDCGKCFSDAGRKQGRPPRDQSPSSIAIISAMERLGSRLGGILTIAEGKATLTVDLNKNDPT